MSPAQIGEVVRCLRIHPDVSTAVWYPEKDRIEWTLTAEGYSYRYIAGLYWRTWESFWISFNGINVRNEEVIRKYREAAVDRYILRGLARSTNRS